MKNRPFSKGTPFGFDWRIFMNKKSKVLVLWGKSNSGKTDTIVQLINLLIDNECVIIKQSDHFKTSADKWCIIEFNGKKLGITTRGDDKESICSDFSEINDYIKKTNSNIDIYICAAHGKGQTFKFLESEFTEKNIYWYAKSRLSIGAGKLCNDFYSIENKNQALGILNILKKI